MSEKTDKPAAPKPANRMVTPSLVKVRATGQPVGEPGGPYHKGQVFETTSERRKALGPLVEDAPAE